MQLEMVGPIEPDNSRFPCYRIVVRMLVTAYLVDVAVFVLGFWLMMKSAHGNDAM